jgi:non-heme chloroperoxidase
MSVFESYSNSSRPFPSALDMPKPARATFVEVEPNVRLHITDVGEGRPVVLIHGWPLSAEMYKYQYSDLVNNGFRAIGISLRGYGRSDKPVGSYSYDVHARDISQVIQQLEIQNPVLVGFSMGAAIALRLVALVPEVGVSRLILAGAAAPLWTQREDFPYNLPVAKVDELIDLSLVDIPNLLAGFLKIFSATQTALNEGIEDWLTAMGLNASAHAITQCLLALRDTDLRSDMKEIKIPTLILHGKKDKICAFALAEQLNAGIWNSELVSFEKSGHSLFLEETEKFNAALIGFAKGKTHEA